MRYLLFIFIFFSVRSLPAQVDTLMSVVSKWDELQVSREKGFDKRNIISGKAMDLQNLTVHTETVSDNKIIHHSPHPEYEELIIIKEGSLQITIDAEAKKLGPGSVALIFPSDKHDIRNISDQPATFYVFRYKARVAPDFERGKKAGGSFMVDWNDLEYKKSPIGGRRDYFHRSTAMLNNFEMHVSTLNEGLTNHEAHTHKAEEFVLMIKGDVVMLIGDTNYPCSEGDVVFVSSMVPHSLNNTGKGETMYFAFQLWQ